MSEEVKQAVEDLSQTEQVSNEPEERTTPTNIQQSVDIDLNQLLPANMEAHLDEQKAYLTQQSKFDMLERTLESAKDRDVRHQVTPLSSDLEIQAKRNDENIFSDGKYSYKDYRVDRRASIGIGKSITRSLWQNVVNPIPVDDSFVFTEELFEEVTKDIDPMFWEEFEDAGSEAEVRRISADIKWRMSMMRRMDTKGYSGAEQFFSSMTDPMFLLAMFATEGMASATLGNVIKGAPIVSAPYKGISNWGKQLMEAGGKAGGRYAALSHIGTLGTRVGTGMAGVSAITASENPMINYDEVPLHFAMGAAFGGTIGAAGMGIKTWSKRIKVPTEAHKMSRKQFIESGKQGSHRDAVLSSIENGTDDIGVILDYYVAERNLPPKLRIVTNASIKKHGKKYFETLELGYVQKTLGTYHYARPETRSEFLIRNYGIKEPNVTFAEALKAQRKITKAKKNLAHHQKTRRKLENELLDVKKGKKPSSELKKLYKEVFEARRKVKQAKQSVQRANRNIKKHDLELDTLIKNIRKNPKKYKRMYKDVLEAEYIPVGKRIVGGHRKKTAHRYHRKQHVKGFERVLFELDELKRIRQSILKDRKMGKKASQKKLKLLKEQEGKLNKFLVNDHKRIVNRLVKNSEVIRGRRVKNLKDAEVNLSKSMEAYLAKRKIKDTATLDRVSKRFKQLVKVENAIAASKKIRRKAEDNLMKLDSKVKYSRDKLAIAKRNVKNDIDAGRAIPESYLENSHFTKIIEKARRDGKEIVTFSERSQGGMADETAIIIEELTPKGEKGTRVAPKISPFISDKANAVYQALVEPFHHLSLRQLKRECVKRGVAYSNNHKEKHLIDLLRTDALKKVSGGGLSGNKHLGDVIKFLEKSGFKFKLVGKGRKTEHKITMLKQYTSKLEREYNKYLELQKQSKKEAKVGKAEKEKTTQEKELPPEPVERDATISMGIFNKASVIVWQPIRKWFNKIPMSFTAELGTLETHGAMRFIAGLSLQDALPRRNPITGQLMPVSVSAESKALMRTHRAFAEAMESYGNSEKRWFKQNKKSVVSKMTNEAEDEFGAEVSKVLRGTYKGNNRHVLKAARDLRTVLKNADQDMALNGIIEKAFNDPNFLPRKIVPSKLVKLIKKYNMTDRKWGSTTIEEYLVKPAIIKGYEKAGIEIGEDHARWLAKAWTRNVHKRGTLVDYNSNGFLGEGGAEILEGYLSTVEGINKKIIKEILDKTRLNPDKSSPNFVKHRLLMDEGFKTKLTDGAGNTEVVAITDLFDNNAKRIVYSHVRQVHGEIAWREIGVKFNEVRGLSNKDYIRPATSDEMWKFIQDDMGKTGRDKPEIVLMRKHFERMEDAVKGRPHGEQSGLATVARVLQKISGSIFGGSFGLAAIAEIGQPLAHSSLKAYLAHMPDLKRLISDFRKGKVSGLQKEIALATGIGTEGKAFREIATMFEHYPMGKGEKLSKWENLFGNTQIKVLKYGGLIPIDAIQRQYASTLFVQHLLNSSLSGRAPYTLKRLFALGLTEAESTSILKMLKKHATYESDGLHKVHLLNWNKWKGAEGQHAALKLQEAIYLHTQKVIHQSHTGNIPHWAQNPMMRTLFQFRFFGMGSLETQLLANLHAADRRSVVSFVTNTFFALLSYMAIMGNKYGADKEKMKEVMSTEELAKGMIWRSGWFANMGGFVDTLLPLVGLDPMSPHSRTSSLTTSWGLSGTPVGSILDNFYGLAKGAGTAAFSKDEDFWNRKNMRHASGMMIGRTLPLIATTERALLQSIPE